VGDVNHAVVPPSIPSDHEVSLIDGRFCAAVCTCGWRSAGRRSRATARAEGHDHALLYADGRLSRVDVSERTDSTAQAEEAGPVAAAEA
jgi:hypothetical protein